MYLEEAPLPPSHKRSHSTPGEGPRPRDLSPREAAKGPRKHLKDGAAEGLVQPASTLFILGLELFVRDLQLDRLFRFGWELRGG